MTKAVDLEVRVADLMTKDVVTLSASDDLVNAQVIMRLKHIRHLPVVKETRLVGLVTQRDLLHALVSSQAELSPAEAARLQGRVVVNDMMTRDVATIGPDEPAKEAGRKLREGSFGCLPVVDGEGILVGIVTEADFVAFAVELLEAMDV